MNEMSTHKLYIAPIGLANRKLEHVNNCMGLQDLPTLKVDACGPKVGMS